MYVACRNSYQSVMDCHSSCSSFSCHKFTWEAIGLRKSPTQCYCLIQWNWSAREIPKSIRSLCSFSSLLNFFSCSTSDAESRKGEPKYVVFHRMLMQLFSMVCFHCHNDNPKVSTRVNGTMVTVLQECAQYGKQFQWRIQPLVFGRFPAGNVLFSFSVLMAGASISKMLFVMKRFGLSVISARTFCYHQQKFLFPLIWHHWEEHQRRLLSSLS